MRKSLIVLIAAAFMAVTAMPAAAQDGGVSISGQALMETYWNAVDSTMNNFINAGTAPFSDTDLVWGMQTAGSFIDFRFKQGDVGGRVTLRPFHSSNSYMEGWWNFGAGTLYVGNTATNFQRPQAALHIIGGVWQWAGNIDIASRRYGLNLVFPVGGGTLKVGGYQPSSVALGGTFVTAAAGSSDKDSVIPILEASYDIKFGGFNLWVGGGYQTYSEVVTSTDKEYDIDSWGIGVYGSYGFGPVTVNGSIFRLQNPYNYGFSTSLTGKPGSPTTTAGFPSYNSTSDDIQDADQTGWHVSAGWRISDMLTLQAGIGANNWERDANPSIGELVNPEDETLMYYINMPIFVAKGVTITPEIGVRDDKTFTTPVAIPASGTLPAQPAGAEVDQGKTTYYGVRWLIRF